MRYRIQTIIFDMDTGICTAARTDGQARTVKLDGLNLLLMQALVQHSDDALTAAVLSARVWGREHVSPDTVAKRVSLLRTSLAPVAGGADIIRTLPNRSYQLVGRAVLLREDGTVSAASNPPTLHKNAVHKNPVSPRPWLLPMLGAIVIAAAAYYFLKGEPRPTLTDPETGLQLVAPAGR